MAAKIVMVASGKGGTGKSTLSVLIGGEIAARGKKVLIIELDSGLRSVDIIAGVYGKTVYDIQDILSGRCEGDKAVVESSVYNGLSVISAPYSGGHICADNLKTLCPKMKHFFDFIIIDTAAGMGEPFTAAKAVCDMALIVITPDPVSVRDGRIVSDDIAENSLKEIRLIINKVQPARLVRNNIKNLDECIDTVAVQLIGVVPYDDNVVTGTANGESLSENLLSQKAVKNIAARICGEYIPLALK